MTVDKKSLTERDICTQYITPAITGAGWELATQVREEVYFTKGQIIVKGKTVKRGKAKRADYILYHRPNLPLAVIEAKDNNESIGAGMQQALEYETSFWLKSCLKPRGDTLTKTSVGLNRWPLSAGQRRATLRPLRSHAMMCSEALGCSRLVRWMRIIVR